MNTIGSIFRKTIKAPAMLPTSFSTLTLFSTLTFTLLSTLILLPSCEKPDRNNPWDDESTFDQQQYAPQNLAIEANSATQVTLRWNYNEIEPGGFAIARRENDGSWVDEFATTQQKTFTDINVNLLENSYEYRVHTFYSTKTSSASEIKIVPPSVTTHTVTEILANSARSGGNATEGIGLEIMVRGVVWSNSPHPQLPSTKQEPGSLMTKQLLGDRETNTYTLFDELQNNNFPADKTPIKTLPVDSIFIQK